MIPRDFEEPMMEMAMGLSSELTTGMAKELQRLINQMRTRTVRADRNEIWRMFVDSVGQAAEMVIEMDETDKAEAERDLDRALSGMPL